MRTTENNTAAQPISVMQRYELKYILSAAQTAFFCERILAHMEPDAYGLTTIASLYYDTPDRLLIRTSIEKPAFKEKIRLRTYGPASEDSPVFLELKRKANGIVYKRRTRSTIPQVERFFSGGEAPGDGGQIDREITFFRDYYRALEPVCVIIYDRTAYCEKDGDLRLTIDRSPRYRIDDLRLGASMDGLPLLAPGETILEIKVQQTIPLWLNAILSEGNIHMGSISKYGEAYKRQMLSA